MLFCHFRDDVCVLSAIGTAAVINPQFTMSEEQNQNRNKPQSAAMSVTPRENDREVVKDLRHMSVSSQKAVDSDSETASAHVPTGCFLCHIPHSKLILPVNGKMRKCAICK